MSCSVHANISGLLLPSCLNFFKNKLITDDIKWMSFSLLCSWRNESPWLQVCAKNTWADELFIKNFIRVPQFHRLELCKNFLRTYSRVQMQQCCRKAGEAVSIIDCESHYLPSRLVIWGLLGPLPLLGMCKTFYDRVVRAAFTEACRKLGTEMCEHEAEVTALPPA